MRFFLIYWNVVCFNSSAPISFVFLYQKVLFIIILKYYNLYILKRNVNVTVGLYVMSFSYSTMPIVMSGIYYLLPTNETYPARFLFRLEHVLNVDKYFNLLMLHAIISVCYVVTIPIATDSLFVLCIQHVCALFEGIRYI